MGAGPTGLLNGGDVNKKLGMNDGNARAVQRFFRLLFLPLPPLLLLLTHRSNYCLGEKNTKKNIPLAADDVEAV